MLLGYPLVLRRYHLATARIQYPPGGRAGQKSRAGAGGAQGAADFFSEWRRRADFTNQAAPVLVSDQGRCLRSPCHGVWGAQKPATGAPGVNFGGSPCGCVHCWGSNPSYLLCNELILGFGRTAMAVPHIRNVFLTQRRCKRPVAHRTECTQPQAEHRRKKGGTEKQ